MAEADLVDPDLMKVLFETPSGFAILGLDGGFLNEEGPLNIIWTKFANETTSSMVVFPCEFQKFENKSDAINHSSGIDGRLAKMIKEWMFGEILLVGKAEHVSIIEKIGQPKSTFFPLLLVRNTRTTIQILMRLLQGFRCRCDELVLEVMWGLKNVLHDVVPEEELELSEEDSKLRSKGLQMFLEENGFDIKSELVNRKMAETACYVHHCSEINKDLLRCMRSTSLLEKEGIDTQGWDAMKYATALWVMCTNDDPSQIQMFPEEDAKKIKGGKGKYGNKLVKDNFTSIYEKAVGVDVTKHVKLEELCALVKEANERAGKSLRLQEVVESERASKKRKMHHQRA